MASAGKLLKFSLQGTSDWAGFPIPNRAEVNFAQPYDICSSTMVWPRSRASVIKLSRVMPSSMAPRPGV
jgi:hypothetical protein